MSCVPAPNFTWIDDAGKPRDLKSFQGASGQPTLLVIAPSPRDWTFRAQVGQLQKAYQRFSAQKHHLLAAFTQEDGRIRSNIPFVTVPRRPAHGLSLRSVEGLRARESSAPDGNLDYLSTKVVPAQRILDIMDANAQVQTASAATSSRTERHFTREIVAASVTADWLRSGGHRPPLQPPHKANAFFAIPIRCGCAAWNFRCP